MASLIENLVEVLNQEDKEYTVLLGLSTKKTSVIVKGDVEALQDIVAQEQIVIDRISVLEKKREEGLADICNVLNVPNDTLQIDKLIQLLEKAPKDQASLIDVHDRLKKTVNQMVTINSNNMELMKQSLEMIEFEVNLARSTKMAPETANYNKGAYNSSDAAMQTGYFDAKQ